MSVQSKESADVSKNDEPDVGEDILVKLKK
jgi:hypothetical protein